MMNCTRVMPPQPHDHAVEASRVSLRGRPVRPPNYLVRPAARWAFRPAQGP